MNQGKVCTVQLASAVACIAKATAALASCSVQCTYFPMIHPSKTMHSIPVSAVPTPQHFWPNWKLLFCSKIGIYGIIGTIYEVKKEPLLGTQRNNWKLVVLCLSRSCQKWLKIAMCVVFAMKETTWLHRVIVKEAWNTCIWNVWRNGWKLQKPIFVNYVTMNSKELENLRKPLFV